jgi:predicted nucleotidyltransferase
MRAKKTTRRGKPDPDVLAGIAERIVEAAEPQNLVLFGLAARGSMGPNSDIDLLVIKTDKFNQWQVLTKIYRYLRGKGATVDVVVATPEDVGHNRHQFMFSRARP